METKIKALFKKGIKAYNSGNDEVALNSFKEASELAKREKYYEILGECYNYIGSIYKNNGRLDESLKFYERALETNEPIGNILNTAISTYNIGNVYHMRGNYSDALKFYKKSVEFYKKLNAKNEIIKVEDKIKEVYILCGKC
ncbi:MAG: tetratricopeptide repeat protein [Candidatus Helarchaeota archaeon]